MPHPRLHNLPSAQIDSRECRAGCIGQADPARSTTSPRAAEVPPSRYSTSSARPAHIRAPEGARIQGLSMPNFRVMGRLPLALT